MLMLLYSYSVSSYYNIILLFNNILAYVFNFVYTVDGLLYYDEAGKSVGKLLKEVLCNASLIVAGNNRRDYLSRVYKILKKLMRLS